MKKVKFFPAPHIEVRVLASDEMIKDLRECARMTKETNYEGGKDCDTCSWREAEIGFVCMCEFGEVHRQILEEG